MVRLRLSALAAASALVTVRPSLGDAQQAPFYYPAPPAGSVVIAKNVQYGRSDTAALRMDVFRPKSATGQLPVLVIFNSGVGAQRSNGFSEGWANAAASHGIVAVLPDIRQDRAADDFRQLIDYLYDHAATYSGDGNAIAVYAGSGNVSSALPLVEDPAKRATIDPPRRRMRIF